jgi:hypothetical protein
MIRNFDRFQKDHWYIFTGNGYNCLAGDKDWEEHYPYLFNKKPVQCKEAFISHTCNFYSYFEGDNGLCFAPHFDD